MSLRVKMGRRQYKAVVKAHECVYVNNGEFENTYDHVCW